MAAERQARDVWSRWTEFTGAVKGIEAAASNGDGCYHDGFAEFFVEEKKPDEFFSKVYDMVRHGLSSANYVAGDGMSSDCPCSRLLARGVPRLESTGSF